jgi:hypothetical protein
MMNLGMELVAVAFIAGTALSAVAGTLSETVFGIPARLDRPFVDANRLFISLARLVLAGPYFSVGEAAGARADGRCSTFAWVAAILFAAGWCLCLGIVALELMSQLLTLLSSAVSAGGSGYEPL